MAESAEDLRQRARSFRQAAEEGPRRNRAYCLTVAYCLEKRLAHLESAQLMPANIAVAQ